METVRKLTPARAPVRGVALAAAAVALGAAAFYGAAKALHWDRPSPAAAIAGAREAQARAYRDAAADQALQSDMTVLGAMWARAHATAARADPAACPFVSAAFHAGCQAQARRMAGGQ